MIQLSALSVIFVTIFGIVSEPENTSARFQKLLSAEIRKTFSCEVFSATELASTEPDNTDRSGTGYYSKIDCGWATLCYVYSGRVYTCRAGGCSIGASAHYDESSEYFDYFILYDTAVKILSVTIYNYEASHGYEITSKGWLKQFLGYFHGKGLDSEKDIDAISGATISVFGITEDVKYRTEVLSELLNKINKN